MTLVRASAPDESLSNPNQSKQALCPSATVAEGQRAGYFLNAQRWKEERRRIDSRSLIARGLS